MAKIINIVKPPTVTVEFTREEALAVRAITGRLTQEAALKLIKSEFDFQYPLAIKGLETNSQTLYGVYDVLDAYFGPEK